MMANDSPASRTLMWLKYALLGFALTLPITISLSEGLAFAAVGLWAFSLRSAERRAWFIRHPLSVPIVLFILLALLFSLVWGVRPTLSASKFHRLALLPLVFAVEAGLRRSTTADTLTEIGRTLAVYLAGAALLGLYDAFRIPLHAFRGYDLFDAGNMRDPQFYMVAVCLLLACQAGQLSKPARRWRLLALGLVLAGVILHFKRGVWFALIVAVLQLIVMTRRWLLLVCLAVFALCLLLVPQVRERLELLRDETDFRMGGRYVLWTDTAPALFAAYPYGMGWCAAKHEDFLEHSTRPVQERLNHLHNNLLQVRLELGWAGLLLWVAMMGTAWWVLAWAAWHLRGYEHPAAPISAGLSCAFTGLLLNGMVESNFSTTSTRMLFCFVMGLGTLYWRAQREQPSGGDS